MLGSCLRLNSLGNGAASQVGSRKPQVTIVVNPYCIHIKKMGVSPYLSVSSLDEGVGISTSLKLSEKYQEKGLLEIQRKFGLNTTELRANTSNFILEKPEDTSNKQVFPACEISLPQSV